MRDRFPLLLVGGLVMLGVLGGFLLKGARRGAFADRLSTFRSEPDGARALYLLLEQSRLPVRRMQSDFEVLEARRGLALLGVRFEGETGGDKPVFDGSAADGGVADDEFDDFKERGLNALRSPRVSKDETDKLLEHVRNGATLLYVPWGYRDNALLKAIDVTLVRADPKLDLRTLVPAQPSRFTRGVERVEAKVHAFLDVPPGAVPLLVDDKLEQVVMALVPYGQGRVILLGAPDLATNQRLGLADNAQLWLSLVGAAASGGELAFDEHHHGFTGDRSMGEFAARYGLQFAAAQLLLGVMLWAMALKRFGKPRVPTEEIRLGGTDALFATSRIYREGKHHAHAASAIAKELAAELAARAGVSGRSAPTDISAALDLRGRKDLSRALLDVARAAATAMSEADVQGVARMAALARRQLHQQSRNTR